MKMVSRHQVKLVNSFDRIDAKNAICNNDNRGVTPFYRRLSVAEEATAMIRVAHGEHEFASIKWDSPRAVY